MKIVKAKKSDIKNVAALAFQVWLNTYSVEGIRDTFSNYLWSEINPEKFEEKFNSELQKFFLLKENNHLIGFVQMNENSESPVNKNSLLEIDKFYIHPNFSGKGYGRAALDFLNEHYKTSRYSEMWLTVYEGNINAVKFYEKTGFICEGEFFFEMENESHRNLVMVKKI